MVKVNLMEEAVFLMRHPADHMEVEGYCVLPAKMRELADKIDQDIATHHDVEHFSRLMGEAE